MTDKNKSSKLGWGLIIGSIAGAIAGIFLAPKSGKENREFAREKLEELKAKIDDAHIKEKAQEIFGEVSEESVKIYKKARVEVAAKLENLKDAIKEIDQEKYKKIIEGVVTDLRQNSKFPTAKLEKLKDYFVKDWQKVFKKPSKK